jgi:transglutaminase-like putative cysteine protease
VLNPLFSSLTGRLIITEITYSKDFYEKFLGATLKEVNSKGFFIDTIKWLIDTKFRTYKNLDSFLKEQLINPPMELTDLAKTFKDLDPDDRIVAILKYVHDRTKYVSDKDNFGKDDFWADAITTFRLGRDDCDGMNNLVYILARLSGIPSEALLCCVGNTALGGHFWVLFFDYPEGRWVSIDSTAWYSSFGVSERPTFSLNSGGYREIWYLFNDDYAFRPR